MFNRLAIELTQKSRTCGFYFSDLNAVWIAFSSLNNVLISAHFNIFCLFFHTNKGFIHQRGSAGIFQHKDPLPRDVLYELRSCVAKTVAKYKLELQQQSQVFQQEDFRIWFSKFIIMSTKDPKIGKVINYMDCDKYWPSTSLFKYIGSGCSKLKYKALLNLGQRPS